MLHFKEVLDKAVALEEKHRLNELKYQGVNVYPIVRYYLVFAILEDFGGAHPLSLTSRNSGVEEQPRGVFKTHGILGLLRGFFQWLTLMIKWRVKGSSILTIGLDSHRTLKNGASDLNRVLETLEQNLSSTQKQRFVHLEKSVTSKNYNRPANVKTFDNCLAVVEAIDSKLRSTGLRGGDLKFEEVIDRLMLDQPNLNKQALLSQIHLTLCWSRFIRFLVKVCGVKMVLIDIYFHPLGYAASLAGRIGKFPVVEIQHGCYGEDHHMYGRLLKMSGEQLVVPQFFAVWSAMEVDIIQRWSRNACTALELGNSSLVFSARMSNKWQHEFRAGAGRRILVSLADDGPEIKTFMESNLFPLISELDSSYHVVYRCHPTFPLDAYLVEKSKAFGIDNYTIENGREINPVESILSSDYHLTLFSSMCLEAHELGVASIVIHPLGDSLYKYHIAKGEMVYFDQRTGIQDALDLADSVQLKSVADLSKRFKDNWDKLLKVAEVELPTR